MSFSTDCITLLPILFFFFLAHPKKAKKMMKKKIKIAGLTIILVCILNLRRVKAPQRKTTCSPNLSKNKALKSKKKSVLVS